MTFKVNGCFSKLKISNHLQQVHQAHHSIQHSPSPVNTTAPHFNHSCQPKLATPLDDSTLTPYTYHTVWYGKEQPWKNQHDSENRKQIY